MVGLVRIARMRVGVGRYPVLRFGTPWRALAAESWAKNSITPSWTAARCRVSVPSRRTRA